MWQSAFVVDYLFKILSSVNRCRCKRFWFWLDLQTITFFCWFQIPLPTYIENVKEKLAENLHELWAMSKIENGWIWGEVNSFHLYARWVVSTARSILWTCATHKLITATVVVRVISSTIQMSLRNFNALCMHRFRFQAETFGVLGSELTIFMRTWSIKWLIRPQCLICSVLEWRHQMMTSPTAMPKFDRQDA